MESPTGSVQELIPRMSPRTKMLIATMCLLIFSIMLIVISIIRNEQRVIALDTQQSIMLKRICEATVTGC